MKAKSVTSANSKVAAPLPSASAGLLSPFAKETSFEEFLLSQFCDVVAVQQVADPALVVLGLVDVGGQIVGEVGHGIDERIAEGEGESEERQHRQRT